MVLVYNFPPRQQIIPGVEHKNESLGKHLVVVVLPHTTTQL